MQRVRDKELTKLCLKKSGRQIALQLDFVCVNDGNTDFQANVGSERHSEDVRHWTTEPQQFGVCFHGARAQFGLR